MSYTIRIGGIMSGTSTRTHRISIRLSNEAYAEYRRLITGASNPHESVGKMIKWVAEWYLIDTQRENTAIVCLTNRKGSVIIHR